MAASTDTAVYEYAETVLVEILGRDEYGDIAAFTYEFSYVDGSGEEVTPRQAIDDDHVEDAEAALGERGYRLTAPRP